MALEKLSSPPIVEVVCGVGFDAIAGLDPIALGGFYEQRKEDYPSYQLHPPIVDSGTLSFRGPLPPIRTWLVSANDAWVVQIQWDRFYLNWRARSGEYPRFSDHEGKVGVLSKFLSEFRAFADYCQKLFENRPVARTFEVSKVDHFEEGRSWQGLGDLAAMLPWLAPFTSASTSKAPHIGAQFREARDGGELTVAMEVAGGVAKLESRLTGVAGADLRSSLHTANSALNEVFARLVPAPERAKRFQGEPR